jgi:hypothetical protein
MPPLELSQADLDFAVDAALTWCTDCLDYHFVRPHQQASGGWTLGPYHEVPVLEPILRRLVPPGGNVLIAASADAGLLAFTHDAIGDLAPRITVADRCETPLAVCRRYATAEGIEISTARADLTETVPEGPFDAVIAHIVLRFIPAERRSNFLRRLGERLTPGGCIVLTHIEASAGASAYRSGMARRINEGFARRGLVIRDPARLEAAIDREAAGADLPGRDLDDIDGLIAEAGLVLVDEIRLPPRSPQRTREWRYMLLGRKT